MNDHVEHSDGLEHEPQFSGRSIVPEESNQLEDEPVRASEVPPEPVEMSVSDEPAMQWAGIDRTRLPGFAEHVRERQAATTPGLMVLVIVLVALSAGPFAVLGAFIKALTGQGGWGYMAIIIVGPVIEEMMKVSGLLWIVERKPWLVPSGGVVLVVGFASGLGFAVIENLLYLYVYYPEHVAALGQWRWSVCMMMHAGCSMIAAIGVGRMLKHTLRTGRPAMVSQAYPWLVTAILIHGGYNALAMILSMSGIGP